jgi:type VI secretion system protein ImpG
MTGEPGEQHLRYYLRELDYLRGSGAEFARRYPRVAGRLDLGDEGSADPHIERLIESFAFLTARLQSSIDRQFPEIAASLLDVLYPQFTAPIPSMAIAQFVADPEQSRSLPGFTLPAGMPVFSAPADDGSVCRFRTAYPVTLWPVAPRSLEFVPPGTYAFLDDRPEVAAVLRLRLGCLGKERFGAFAPTSLRFFLHGPLATTSYLYELLFNRTLEIAVLPGDDAAAAPGERVMAAARRLAAGCIRPVGFGADEGVLPCAPHAHQAYLMLQEYFIFPEKYLFFDIEGLDQPGILGAGQEADLLFLFSEQPRDGLAIDRETVRLGCTPIINLFRRMAEPVRLDETQWEYRLVPDSRFERSTEIHSILSVSGSLGNEETASELRPYFSFTHADQVHPPTGYWAARRQPTVRRDLHGSDIFISFLDLDFSPQKPAAKVVFAHTFCTNRGLAEVMPAGAPLQIEVDAPVRGVRCLTKPTRQLEPPFHGEALWRLVSLLSLNHLSLSSGPESLAALQEILRHCAASRSSASLEQIRGLAGLATRRIVRRIGDDAWRGFCRGTGITLEVDETRFAGASAFLLGAVLNRFFALYAAADSFTELSLTSRQRDGIWTTWPPLCGETPVL